MKVAPSLSPALLEEAADWIITLHFSQPSDKDREAFERWRSTSAAHQEAWTRAEHMRASFGRVSSGVSKSALGNLNALNERKGRSKRDTLRKLGMLAAILPAGWLAWRQLPWVQWSADIATRKGERRTLALADGSQLTLNGNSAVDIAFTASERRLILRAGEILITTHPDNASQPRPFLVETPQGIARALGTLFSVRISDASTRIAVFEHAVEFSLRDGSKFIVQRGQQALFSESRLLQTSAADPNARQWENGMLVARNMRLAEVVAELDRHRQGFLRCDPAVADMRISGALSLDDVDASLRILAQDFPLQIRQRSHFWLTVEPRSMATDVAKK